MNDLNKAIAVRAEIQELTEEIHFLENNLTKVAEDDLEVKYKCRIKKQNNEVKEESSEIITSETPYGLLSYSGYSRRQKKNWDIQKTLTPKEFIIMHVPLLDYKKRIRKDLINQFEKLGKSIIKQSI